MKSLDSRHSGRVSSAHLGFVDAQFTYVFRVKPGQTFTSYASDSRSAPLSLRSNKVRSGVGLPLKWARVAASRPEILDKEDAEAQGWAAMAQESLCRWLRENEA